MRAPTLFGGLSVAAAAVCLALGGPDGLGAGVVLGLVCLVWLLGRRPGQAATPGAPALCAPDGERCADMRAPTKDEARGMVFAALLAEPRAPWCLAIVEGRGPWMPLVRVTPGGPRPQVIATRWGDA